MAHQYREAWGRWSRTWSAAVAPVTALLNEFPQRYSSASWDRVGHCAHVIHVTRRIGKREWASREVIGCRRTKFETSIGASFEPSVHSWPYYGNNHIVHCFIVGVDAFDELVVAVYLCSARWLHFQELYHHIWPFKATSASSPPPAQQSSHLVTGGDVNSRIFFSLSSNSMLHSVFGRSIALDALYCVPANDSRACPAVENPLVFGLSRRKNNPRSLPVFRPCTFSMPCRTRVCDSSFCKPVHRAAIH